MSGTIIIAECAEVTAEREGLSLVEALVAAVAVLAAREPALAIGSHVAAQLLEQGSARVAGPWEWVDGLARQGDDTCERQAVVDGRTRPVAQITDLREIVDNEDGDAEYGPARWEAGVRTGSGPQDWETLGEYATLAEAAAACDAALRPLGWALRGPATPPEPW